MKLDMNWWAWTSLILLLIGGINWGLIGIFEWNLVAAIFGEVWSRIIYIVVSLAAILMIIDASMSSGHTRTQAHT